MVDLNKKTLPDPHQEPDETPAISTEIFEEEIIKAIEEENKLIQQYKKSCSIHVAVAFLIVIWVPLITLAEKRNSSIWMLSYLWGIVIPLTMTVIMLLVPPGNGLTHSDGSPIKVKGQWWKKAAYYILAWVPWYSCIVLRFDVHPLNALWITPLSLVILIILTLTQNSRNDPMGTSSVTPSDYRSVRLNQQIGGLNPKTIPPAFMTAANKDAVMRMTPTDWRLLGHKLYEAGYKNIFMKRK